MGVAHPEDYENIRLTQGDGGLDGILLSTSTAFAVFAPRESSGNAVVTKMQADFVTACSTMERRGAKLLGMVFVHNDEGLTKVTGPALVKLAQANPGVRFTRWTFERIWQELETLTIDQLTDLFGVGPTEENVDRLTFPSIREVIEFLSQAEPRTLAPIGIPDPEKLEHNNLSPEQADMLRVGRHRQGLVGDFLDAMTDPTTGERIAEAFRDQYASLKDGGMTAPEIFTVLSRFAGCEHFTQPDQIAAVMAVMAYFFSSCDIFENVRNQP